MRNPSNPHQSTFTDSSSGIVVSILVAVPEAHFAKKGYWSAGFDLSPKTLELIKNGHIRFTIDQQPYVQGFYPVVALTLNLRYGIAPSNIDSGESIIDSRNVKQIMQLTAEGYR